MNNKFLFFFLANTIKFALWLYAILATNLLREGIVGNSELI